MCIEQTRFYGAVAFNLYGTIDPCEMDTVWHLSSNAAHSHVQVTVCKKVQGAADPL